MENLIESLIFIIFVIVVIATKLLEKKSGKKILKPEQIFIPKEEYEWQMVEQEEKEIKQAPVKIKKTKHVAVPEKVPEEIIVESPDADGQTAFFSRDKLQEGIILSVVLGPPKSRR